MKSKARSFDSEAAEELSISDWGITEFSAALFKWRMNQLATTERADALAAFARLCAQSLTILPVSRAQFRTAARFADHHILGLRGSDALQLAICGDERATLCTLDQRVSQLGAALAYARSSFD